MWASFDYQHALSFFSLPNEPRLGVTLDPRMTLTPIPSCVGRYNIQTFDLPLIISQVQDSKIMQNEVKIKKIFKKRASNQEFFNTSPRVNFINILHAAFTRADPKCTKRHSSRNSVFMRYGDLPAYMLRAKCWWNRLQICFTFSYNKSMANCRPTALMSVFSKAAVMYKWMSRNLSIIPPFSA